MHTSIKSFIFFVFIFQGCIGQVDVPTVLCTVEHLIPIVEIHDPEVLETDKASTATLTEDTSTSSESLQPLSAETPKDSTLENTPTEEESKTEVDLDKTDTEVVEQHLMGEVEPEHETKPGDVHFILNSDTDEELDVKLDDLPNSDKAEDIDIGSDLSALAADILGTKSDKPTDKID